MEAVASKPVIKAVALCGSLRKGSFSHGLLRSAIQITFRQKILQADSVLSASPEYNYSVTAPLKNAIDWASRPPNCWSDKAAAIVSMELLTTSFTYCIEIYLDLHFINKPEFHLNAFAPPAKFDSDGNLIDPQSKNRLKEVLLSLFAFTSRLKGNC
ncbi:hypothetical protein OIU77_026503 [Salix suchowensis]|uniref:NAD(P)H dehydrogenase (quinone) n=1 Tax=Salix suchowensis TaxID=1278906 RepID=A0ABQ9BN76_9ROSI|nr:hypothetical protein OIU77_026503 [Salix suchowensis]